MARQPNRRTFVLSTAAAAGALRAGFPAPARAAARSYSAEYPDMLLKHVAAKLNTFASFWNQQRERIRSAEDIEKRNRYVRAKFKEMIHGYSERTPLTPKTTAVHERDGYRIEN